MVLLVIRSGSAARNADRVLIALARIPSQSAGQPVPMIYAIRADLFGATLLSAV